MCETCGCGGESSAAGHNHTHGHDHRHEVRLGQDLLDENRRYADANRARFATQGIAAVNVLGSPGAGKTSLLARTIVELKSELRIAVITGDLAGSEDKERLESPGVQVHQIQTGRVCHLDAHMVGHAADHIDLERVDLLFLENVGNLVCPAAFDLGESKRVVVLSVTEGADKPSKYPEMFMSADAVVLSKIDLMPHLDFDLARAERDIRRLRFTAEILKLSARSGDGFEAWVSFLRRLVK